MKKQYISPAIESITIESNAIIALSESININDSNSGGNDEKGGYDPGSSLSREENNRGGIWDSKW